MAGDGGLVAKYAAVGAAGMRNEDRHDEGAGRHEIVTDRYRIRKIIR
jgi:hypothetical protein